MQSMVTAAKDLAGRTLKGGWRVIQQIKPGPHHSGSHFSIGYLVEHEPDGTRGFLKALDYSIALQSDDPPTALEALVVAYNYERNLLKACRGMSRVITAITDGIVTVPGYGELSTVNYLIFELADRDARAQLDIIDRFDIAWRLRALHHVAAGMRQLHSGGIAHQDIKPSNVLVFQKGESKVGDLGRATVKGNISPFDDLDIAGAMPYAPPELIYGYAADDWVTRRLGCDAYLLGSLVLFFFTRVSATPAILAKLHPSHRPKEWGGDFQSVLPFLRDAWDRVIEEYENEILDYTGTLGPELVQIAQQLTEPDPSRRGHPKTLLYPGNPYSLERYVSKFELIARKAEVKLF